jgi:hypothetical protein
MGHDGTFQEKTNPSQFCHGTSMRGAADGLATIRNCEGFALLLNGLAPDQGFA